MTTPEGSPEDEVQSPEDTMDYRRERVRFETERHRIEGFITLARDGFRSRVSDVLNASERDFLTLTDVTITPHEGEGSEHHRYLTVARRHVVFAVSAAGEEPHGGLAGTGGLDRYAT